MPLYFFHTQTSSRVSDEEGMELPNMRSAQHEAIRTAGEMMRDGVDVFWGTRPWSVTVTNDAGLILLEIEMDGVAAPAFPDR